MSKRKTLNARDLIGYQSPDNFFNYASDCQDLAQGEREPLWIIMKVFLYGRIIGIREERARRKRGIGK